MLYVSKGRVRVFMKEIQLHRIDLNLLVVFETLMVEGSVTGAAEKLGKTPSAISHALARLRDQLGDPLLVKVGGRMQPSTFAMTLIEDVRPILRSIKRVLALPEPFDPATSNRVFRVACPITGRVLSEVLNSVHHMAPSAKVEWLAAPRQVYDAVAEGLVDIAHLAGETRLPDGLDEVDVPGFKWKSFVRADHPALSNWGPEAWATYPHVQVNISNDARSPFDRPGTQRGLCSSRVIDNRNVLGSADSNGLYFQSEARLGPKDACALDGSDRVPRRSYQLQGNACSPVRAFAQ